MMLEPDVVKKYVNAVVAHVIAKNIRDYIAEKLNETDAQPVLFVYEYPQATNETLDAGTLHVVKSYKWYMTFVVYPPNPYDPSAFQVALDLDVANEISVDDLVGASIIPFAAVVLRSDAVQPPVNSMIFRVKFLSAYKVVSIERHASLDQHLGDPYIAVYVKRDEWLVLRLKHVGDLMPRLPQGIVIHGKVNVRWHGLGNMVLQASDSSYYNSDMFSPSAR